jgi:molybdopterin-guanine dinucleotide biosynthesis adapter protein
MWSVGELNACRDLLHKDGCCILSTPSFEGIIGCGAAMSNSPTIPTAIDLLDGLQPLDRAALLALADAVARRLAPPVVSVAAKSGTGKTTFMERLIPELRARGLRVGVLKHHGHATPFDAPGKDTYRLAQAGAEVVIGASAAQVAVFRQEDGAADLDAVIARHAAGLDLLLTEGYKRGPYPKIEINRAERSAELLCQPDELLALVSDTAWPLAVPQFGLEDAAGVADFLAGWLAAGGVR